MNEKGNTSTEEVTQKPAIALSTAGILDIFLNVIRQPGGFFESMPRTGGFVQPLIFMIIMGVVSGLVRAVLGFAGLQSGMHGAMVLTSIILGPVLITIFGFIGAAILFVIWKLMGSKQNYETAYRCTAYGSAISPITQLLMVIPYFGVVLVMAWWTIILVLASTQVHQIRKGVAASVFAILAILLSISSISAQIAAHRIGEELRQSQYNRTGTKDPAKAMQQLGKMFEQMGKAAQQQKSGQ